MMKKRISHYQILEKIGEGGMGEVYKAKDTKLDRIVALKLLPAQSKFDQKLKKRFVQEAKTIASLNHPNICTIYELYEDKDQSFIVMEFIDGPDLKQKIKINSFSIQDASKIAEQILQGLKEVHTKGIIHSDIKSANIILSNESIIKITDFGIAKLKRSDSTNERSIHSGTLPYKSPEQVSGEKIDHRTDIWSFGILYYEMLTARLPFLHDYEDALIYQILNKSPEPPKEICHNVPQSIEHIVLKCLQKDPENRYQNIEEILHNLKRADIGKQFGQDITQGNDGSRRESERRQVTILCIEILGYPALFEDQDSEKTAFTLNQSYKQLKAINDKHNGMIQKKAEDNYTIVFNLPTVVEDAPKRAINTAIEFRNTIKSIKNIESEINSLSCRAGITTGTVITGFINQNQHDYTVIGEASVLASQIKDHAHHDQILIDDMTYRLACDYFQFKSVAPIKIPGKKYPVINYKLVSDKERPHRRKLGTERKIYSKLIGRDKALDTLHSQLLNVIHGKGAIVNVIAEAGIGKSRLISELKMKEAFKQFTCLEGRGLSVGQNMSFYPIIDLLTHWAGIRETDTEQQSLNKFLHVIREVDPEEANEIFPFIAMLMGLKPKRQYSERVKGIEGESMEKLLAKHLRDLFSKASQQKPLVLIIEDLHWVDHSTIELLESLFRCVENHQILFINVFRPLYTSTGERICQSVTDRYLQHYVEIRLDALSKPESEALINNLLDNQNRSPKLVKEIIDRTGGNPFFIEEIIHSMIDQGFVVKDRDRFIFHENTTTLRIPQTVHEVLMARVDRLDEDTRSLLKIASVIGRYFYYTILMEVGVTIDQLDEKLKNLENIQIIGKQKRKGEIEYYFRHILLQQIVYDSILIKQRKQLHLQVGEAISRHYQKRLFDFYGSLAYHFCIGEDLNQAEYFLIKAGERSLKLSASGEALNYFQQALNLYLEKYSHVIDNQKVGILEKNIGTAFHYSGQFYPAILHFNAALRFLGKKQAKHKIIIMFGMIRNMVNLIIYLYKPYKSRKNPDTHEKEMIDVLTRKSVAAFFWNPKDFFIYVLETINYLLRFDIGSVENGISVFSSCSSIFSWSGRSFRISEKMLNYCQKYLSNSDIMSIFPYETMKLSHDYFKGQWSITYKKELVSRFLLKGGYRYEVLVYIALSCYIYIEKADHETVSIIMDQLEKISDTYENDVIRACQYELHLKYLLKSTRFHEIKSIEKRVLTFASETKFVVKRIFLYLIFIRLYMVFHDVDKAEALLNQAEELAVNQKCLHSCYLSYYHATRLFFYVKKLENAVLHNNKTEIRLLKSKVSEINKKAIRISKRIVSDKTEILRLSGVYYWLIGKYSNALQLWKLSMECGENMGATIELANTCKEIGKRLSKNKSRYKALNGLIPAEYLKKSSRLFHKLNIRDYEPDEEQLDGKSK